jgi:UDP-GlcNAc:undecaprenyl-phosphate GlcNAc-1-phosphate transferase
MYLYAWTLMLAGLALALRFIPYSNHHGRLNLAWTIVLFGYGVIVALASVYLVYLLEIVKFRGRAAWLANRRAATTAAATSAAAATRTDEPRRRAGGARRS